MTRALFLILLFPIFATADVSCWKQCLRTDNSILCGAMCGVQDDRDRKICARQCAKEKYSEPICAIRCDLPVVVDRTPSREPSQPVVIGGGRGSGSVTAPSPSDDGTTRPPKSYQEHAWDNCPYGSYEACRASIGLPPPPARQIDCRYRCSLDGGSMQRCDHVCG